MDKPIITPLLPLGACCYAISALVTPKGWDVDSKSRAGNVSYLPCETGKAPRDSTSSRFGVASQAH